MRLTGTNGRTAWLGPSEGGGPSDRGGLQHLGGHLVVGLDVAEPGLAGPTGLVRAVSAGGGAVELVVGGYVERGDDSADVGAGENDRVICVRVGRSWFGVGARRGVVEVSSVGGSRFHYASVVEFSERLAGLLPEPLDTVFLVNSGSEAVDLAIRLALVATGHRDVVAVREAYHGWTYASDAVSTSTADNPNALATRPRWVHAVDAPNSYRGRYRGADADRYAADAAAAISELAASGRPPAAFLAEPFYGNAGGMALPDGYLAAVYAEVRRCGGLAIADEIQVGYGRLGHWFWGFEQQGVVPDVVTVAKAMGNGYPLGAVVTSRAIAERYRDEGYFFSSTGGSPVSCVIGLTVLDVIRDEGLAANAARVGGHLKARLEELAGRHELIGAVHGSGLYLGVEFVRDRLTLEPATEETMAICDRMLELGVVIQPTSDRMCVLKIKPPLCLDTQGADFFADALDRVLTQGW